MKPDQFKLGQLVKVDAKAYGLLAERHPKMPSFRVVLLTRHGDYGSTAWFHWDQIEVIE